MASSKSFCQKLHIWFIVDWLIILLLLGIGYNFEWIGPVQREITFDPSINYPHHLNNTVPSWSLLIICIVVPVIFMVLFFLLERWSNGNSNVPRDANPLASRPTSNFVFFSRQCSLRTLHLCILGLFLTLAITYFSSNVIKIVSGRPRPDFISRCKPESIQDNPLKCTTPEHSKIMKDGRKSFPSGHAAFSFAGLGYLCLFFYDEFGTRHTYGRTIKSILLLLPLMGATYVAISRVTDNRHHWQDVTVGGILGLSLALACYTLHFKNPLKRAFATERRPYLIPVSYSPSGPGPQYVSSDETLRASKDERVAI